jgi:hypothetical protein
MVGTVCNFQGPAQLGVGRRGAGGFVSKPGCSIRQSNQTFRTVRCRVGNFPQRRVRSGPLGSRWQRRLRGCSVPLQYCNMEGAMLGDIAPSWVRRSVAACSATQFHKSFVLFCFACCRLTPENPSKPWSSRSHTLVISYTPVLYPIRKYVFDVRGPTPGRERHPDPRPSFRATIIGAAHSRFQRGTGPVRHSEGSVVPD